MSSPTLPQRSRADRGGVRGPARRTRTRLGAATPRAVLTKDNARTTFVHRLDTTGGTAPAASTRTPEHAGERVEVPYTTDHVFWKKG